jgi:hypothetical protein
MSSPHSSMVERRLSETEDAVFDSGCGHTLAGAPARARVRSNPGPYSSVAEHRLSKAEAVWFDSSCGLQLLAKMELLANHGKYSGVGKYQLARSEGDLVSGLQCSTQARVRCDSCRGRQSWHLAPAERELRPGLHSPQAREAHVEHRRRGKRLGASTRLHAGGWRFDSSHGLHLAPLAQGSLTAVPGHQLAPAARKRCPGLQARWEVVPSTGHHLAREAELAQHPAFGRGGWRFEPSGGHLFHPCSDISRRAPLACVSDGEVSVWHQDGRRGFDSFSEHSLGAIIQWQDSEHLVAKADGVGTPKAAAALEVNSPTACAARSLTRPFDSASPHIPWPRAGSRLFLGTNVPRRSSRFVRGSYQPVELEWQSLRASATSRRGPGSSPGAGICMTYRYQERSRHAA